VRGDTHTQSSIQVRTDAGVDKYALTFDIPSSRKGWLLLAGGGLCRDKFPKLPRSLAIMSAISGDGVGYRHEGNLKRRTGGINTTSTNLRRRLGDACFFFFFSRDGHSPFAFGVVGERSIDTALRLFRNYCLTMRIK